MGGDDSTAGNAGTAGQVLVSKGADEAPAWENPLVPTVAPTANGTVIAIDGQLKIAQEIAVQIPTFFQLTGPANVATPIPIGNLTDVIIDNENTYSGNAVTNSFTVSEDGIYQVVMSIQFTSNLTTPGDRPTFYAGVWNNAAGEWIAMGVQSANVSDNGFTGFQYNTLTSSISLLAGEVYSFRIAKTTGSTITMYGYSSGFALPRHASHIMVKRLR
ncbi:hypothetical protein [Moheibacter sediminis]|uniref:C1q domain-containing protein n=1 Tax=Moheibacter sediminis TaxID=1434700 RepID=A0A1W1Z5P9_9FLAO|nr:hypothetical protein [Moheibacter sediminis]SMC43733.1 hypothetical protein SAMN06296427_102219 [Moheibacter sediminis]